MTAILKTPARWPRILLPAAEPADPTDLDTAVVAGAFEALRTAVRAMTPGQLIAAVADSGLRGRGGGGLPDRRRSGAPRRSPMGRSGTSSPTATGPTRRSRRTGP